MTKAIRFLLVSAMGVCLAGAVCSAQSGGEATYKAKCAMCHGADGTPKPAMATAMGIKPATDPSIKALSVAEMTATVKNGKGKMHPVAGLSDAQIADVVSYFRSLK
jgi:mono/diheme cytochrome c family protein